MKSASMTLGGTHIARQTARSIAFRIAKIAKSVFATSCPLALGPAVAFMAVALFEFQKYHT
jgi:hypothetical protein